MLDQFELNHAQGRYAESTYLVNQRAPRCESFETSFLSRFVVTTETEKCRNASNSLQFFSLKHTNYPCEQFYENYFSNPTNTEI